MLLDASEEERTVWVSPSTEAESAVAGVGLLRRLMGRVVRVVPQGSAVAVSGNWPNSGCKGCFHW